LRNENITASPARIGKNHGNFGTNIIVARENRTGGPITFALVALKAGGNVCRQDWLSWCRFVPSTATATVVSEQMRESRAKPLRGAEGAPDSRICSENRVAVAIDGFSRTSLWTLTL
jgi:hypothetical protein